MNTFHIWIESKGDAAFPCETRTLFRAPGTLHQPMEKPILAHSSAKSKVRHAPVKDRKSPFA